MGPLVWLQKCGKTKSSPWSPTNPTWLHSRTAEENRRTLPPRVPLLPPARRRRRYCALPLGFPSSPSNPSSLGGTRGPGLIRISPLLPIRFVCRVSCRWGLFVADSRAAKMRPVFVGNLDFDTRHSELDHLFYRYGRIERIDMKSGLLAFTLPPPPPIVCPPRSAFVFDFWWMWAHCGVPRHMDWCLRFKLRKIPW